ncbi:MAG: NAD-binding protein, partial [Methanomassiliicoccales archaeon]
MGTRRRLQYSLLLLIGTVLFGAVGFYLVEEQVSDLSEAFYLTLVTMTTVGYGDIVPVTPVGRVIASVVMVTGIGTAFYFFQSLFGLVVSQSLREELGLPQRKTKLKDHFIVVGYGNVGKQIIEQLRSKNERFIVIENDEERVERMVGEDIPVIEGDASDDNVLIRANIQGALGIITTLTDPMNVIVVISAKMINPDIQVVSKVDDYRNVIKLRKAGADSIVNCQEMGARAMVGKAREVAIDPVSGEEVKVSETPFVQEVGGERFYFGSRENMDVFLENPKRFMVMKRAFQTTCGL